MILSDTFYEFAMPLMPLLEKRRLECDAMVCIMSAPEVTRLTRIGKFDMSGPTSTTMSLLKKLRAAGITEEGPGGK